MTYKFQITYDRKLTFSGFISVTERFIPAKFQQNLRWSPWEQKILGDSIWNDSFHNFLEHHSTLTDKKIFVTNFPFLTDSLKPSPPN